MKTITEFSGFTIKQAIDLRTKLIAEGVAPEQQNEKLGEQASLSGDRLSRLVEALDAVGDQVDKVRLVRVFPVGETEMKGAKKVGEFNYVLDFHPNISQARGGQGGRGDRDKGRGRGGPGGGGGGGGGGRPGGFGKDRSPYEKEPPRGSTPSAGAGWVLSRAPALPGERRDGDKRGPGGKRPGKPGNRPGRPGGGPGGRPGGGPGGGGPGGGGPGRQHAGPGRPSGGPGGRVGGGPGGSPGGRPPGGPGGAPDRGPRDPNAPAGQRPHRGRGGRPQGPPPVVVHARPHAPAAAPAPAAPEAAPTAAPSNAPENT